MGLFWRKQETIDLAEPTEADIETVQRVRSKSGGQLTFGAPSRCPECASYGHVVFVDDTSGLCENNCPACRSSWRINRRALEVKGSPNQEITPVGGGILIEALAETA